MKDLTEKEILELAEYMLTISPGGDASENVGLDIARERPVTERERKMEELITSLYRLIHPYVSSCNHQSWKEEFINIAKQERF